ncbi:MAG: DNA repair protein RecO [Patescibacteria group bacterium]|nr:DNA repair protein RecO [Patescibacteria group bacterium]
MFFRNLLKVEGFILKKKSLLENDVLSSVFTKERGKIFIIAKGAKKITSRRLSFLETGNFVKLILHSSNGSLFLKEVQLIKHQAFYRLTLSQIRIFYQFLYLLDRLLPENQAEPRIFFILKKFLDELAKIEEKKIGNFFYQNLNRLFFNLGYTRHFLAREEANRLISQLIDQEISSIGV